MFVCFLLGFFGFFLLDKFILSRGIIKEAHKALKENKQLNETLVELVDDNGEIKQLADNKKNLPVLNRTPCGTCSHAYWNEYWRCRVNLGMTCTQTRKEEYGFIDENGQCIHWHLKE